MFQEYFNAKVIQKELRPKKIKERIGIFRYNSKVIETYFLKVKIEGTKFILNIPVEKEIYDNSIDGGQLSVYLKCEYKFSCFHFMPIKNEIKEVEI